MRQRARRSFSGNLPGTPMPRLATMLTLLVVVGILYQCAREPNTWRWLAAGEDSAPLAEAPQGRGAAEKTPVAPAETVVPGPTDRDEDQAAEAQRLFQAVSDREGNSEVEMPAYWVLMKWARAQTFAELERRSNRNIVFTQLWQQPEEYRGKLVRLRLHIRRIISHDAPTNSANVKTVYEVSGATDESKSYPYIVVVPELPPGMKIGGNVQEEGVFVGYFLKTMRYETAEKPWAAPLLIGRLRSVPSGAGAASSKVPWLWLAAGVVLIVGLAVWRGARSTRKSATPRPVSVDSDVPTWLQGDASATSSVERALSDDRPNHEPSQ